MCVLAGTCVKAVGPVPPPAFAANVGPRKVVCEEGAATVLVSLPHALVPRGDPMTEDVALEDVGHGVVIVSKPVEATVSTV